MLRFVTQALLVSTTVAQVTNEVSSPQLSNDGENFIVRLPRDGDMRFSRTQLQEVSLNSVEERLSDLETFRENAVEMLTNKTSEGIAPTIESLASSYYSTFKETSESQLPKLDGELKNATQYVRNTFNDQSKFLIAQFNTKIDDLKNMLSESSRHFLAKYNASMKHVEQRLAASKEAVDSVQQLQSSIKTSVASGKWLNGKEVGKMPNWCFKWGNGIDDYNSAWRKYSGMDCKVASTSGWLKITLEGRTYGCNHGGLRVVGGGKTFGRQGTYGFQWMNSEHHGHRWLPFNIVRYVKTTPGKLINYELQFRAQRGGCRFHIHGGNYNEQYSGLWWSIEEAQEPMSRN